MNLTGTPPPSDALFQGRSVNHVTLRVKDVEESRRFYQELLGGEASVLLDARTSDQTGSIDLLLGDSFVTVSGGRGVADIDHFAIGLDPWPGADRALDMVQKRLPTGSGYNRASWTLPPWRLTLYNKVLCVKGPNSRSRT